MNVRELRLALDECDDDSQVWLCDPSGTVEVGSVEQERPGVMLYPLGED